MEETKFEKYESEVYTVSDVQDILNISKTLAYEIVKQNLFPVIKIRTSIRIPKKGFHEWIDSHNKL